MEQIQTLSTTRGRSLLRDIFRELRFEKQVSGFTALLTCWRLCALERDIYRYSRFQVTAIHSLGIFRGTSLWMREIVNRFYFSTINSLVYLGAAILLVIIAAYRFSETIDTRLVVGSVLFEAALLLLLFVVMFFSPADDIELEQEGEEEEASEIRQLISEVGDISTEYAASAEKLDTVSATLTEIAALQRDLIASVQKLSELTASAVAPTPEFTTTVRQTNDSLVEFTRSVRSFIDAAEALHRDEIHRAVRSEVERVLVNRFHLSAQEASSVARTAVDGGTAYSTAQNITPPSSSPTAPLDGLDGLDGLPPQNRYTL